MPIFNIDEEKVMDVSIGEFLDACEIHEIEELLSTLKNEGWFNYPRSVMEIEFDNITKKIYQNRLQLTNEEEEILKKIANRF
jgi:hypothetical protein